MNSEQYHRSEAIRIQDELDSLPPSFAQNGIVKTILRDRVADEKKRALLGNLCDCHDCKMRRKQGE